MGLAIGIRRVVLTAVAFISRTPAEITEKALLFLRTSQDHSYSVQ